MILICCHIISWTCPNCNAVLDNNKDFCDHCGTKRPGGEIELWKCESCGKEDNVNAFCSSCGAPRNKTEKPIVKIYEQWKCLACGNENNTLNFCGECGAIKGQKETAAQRYARLSAANTSTPQKKYKRTGTFNKDEHDPKFVEEEYQSWYESICGRRAKKQRNVDGNMNFHMSHDRNSNF